MTAALAPTGMPYEPTAAERAWADSAADPAAAARCIPVAAAFNRLDAELLLPRLAPNCLYGSQSVLEELHGKDAVAAYLREKLAALRGAGEEHLVTAELAADPAGGPCVLIRQRTSGWGRPGLGHAAAFYRAAGLPDGRIRQLYLVTSVPPPERCAGAGLFPGLTAERVRAAREYAGPRLPLTAEVTFLLFAKPRVGACDEMVRSLPLLMEEYRPARLRVVTPAHRETCVEYGVSGFPTLIVARRGEPVRTLDGYRTNEQLRDALADLFER